MTITIDSAWEWAGILTAVWFTGAWLIGRSHAGTYDFVTPLLVLAWTAVFVAFGIGLAF